MAENDGDDVQHPEEERYNHGETTQSNCPTRWFFVIIGKGKDFSLGSELSFFGIWLYFFCGFFLKHDVPLPQIGTGETPKVIVLKQIFFYIVEYYIFCFFNVLDIPIVHRKRF